MIINSITLKNFKSYEDETTINLRPTEGKNIVLIGGENGAGKSTLFEAIKICIYGATSFGYAGQTYRYTDKLKGMICNNAFTKEAIEAYVKLDLSFTQGIEEVTYTLQRKWNYQNQKINEDFRVYQGEKELVDDDFNYFDEFLKSELPPSLFDFFFFDGEELNTMFTAQKGSSELKNAVLQLLNYNSFELLRKQLLHYERSLMKGNETLETAQKKYEQCLADVNKAKETIVTLNERIATLEQALHDKEIEKETLDIEFRKSGGILEDERNELTAQIAQIENARADIASGIRNFCNDKLPFLLLKDQLKDLLHQVKAEEEKRSYHSFRDKLTTDVIKNAFQNYQHLGSDQAENVTNQILDQIFNLSEINSSKEILGLSKEQAHQVMMTCNETFRNTYHVSDEYRKHNELSLELASLRKKLHSSVSGEILNQYLADSNRIANEIQDLIKQIENATVKKANTEELLVSLTRNLTISKNQTIDLLQKSNIMDMSDRLTKFLDELLSTLTESKIALVEEEFIKIFEQIIRKNNFIDTMKLDKNFNSTLYILKEYYPIDVINMIDNIGFSALENKYGKLFLDNLFELTQSTNEKEIKSKLATLNMAELLPLHTKVNIGSLSNGERQVFVLCLIWAILKVSDVNIPFIIDTPYARIDTTHRNGLSTLYLPNISKQVIILSTNEEIDQTLYQTIKPYVCNEYLLVYDTAARKTLVKNNYFEV